MQAEISLSEFEAKGPPRRAGCWYSRLDPERQAKADAALAAGYSHTTIGKVVTDWGIPCARTTISKHFNKECACG